MELCDKAKEIHKKKNDDYAEESSKFFNFEVQAQFIKWFDQCDFVDQSFAAICGLKVARIANLLSKKGEPNNESITDSFEDLFIYVGLWHAWQFEGKEVKKEMLLSIAGVTHKCIVCDKWIMAGEIPYGSKYNQVGREHKYKHASCRDLEK